MLITSLFIHSPNTCYGPVMWRLGAGTARMKELGKPSLSSWGARNGDGEGEYEAIGSWMKIAWGILPRGEGRVFFARGSGWRVQGWGRGVREVGPRRIVSPKGSIAILSLESQTFDTQMNTIISPQRTLERRSSLGAIIHFITGPWGVHTALAVLVSGTLILHTHAHTHVHTYMHTHVHTHTHTLRSRGHDPGNSGNTIQIQEAKNLGSDGVLPQLSKYLL